MHAEVLDRHHSAHAHLFAIRHAAYGTEKCQPIAFTPILLSFLSPEEPPGCDQPLSRGEDKRLRSHLFPLDSGGGFWLEPRIRVACAGPPPVRMSADVMAETEL